MTELQVGWYLYRAYNDAGELLYVGKSNNAVRRWREHMEAQPWAHEVTTWRRDPRVWESEAACLAAERQAIRFERPRYNIVHNGANRRRVDPRTMRRPAPGRPQSSSDGEFLWWVPYACAVVVAWALLTAGLWRLMDEHPPTLRGWVGAGMVAAALIWWVWPKERRRRRRR